MRRKGAVRTDQHNTFDTRTMDSWSDRVYYEGKEFPAGHFAAEILNFTILSSFQNSFIHNGDLVD